MEAVQKVKCINSGWFVLSFWVVVEGCPPLSSQDLPIRRAGTIDLSVSDLQEGMEIELQIKAAMGKILTVRERFRSARNGKTAVFEVHGTSLDFSIRLVEVEKNDDPV